MRYTAAGAAFSGVALAVALNVSGTAQAPNQPLRAEVRVTNAVVAAGRTFAADAGARLLSEGGNAVDAGVASMFAAAGVEVSHFGLLGGAFVAGDTGVPMSNRMQAFRLEPESPNVLAGGKWPRTTLTPTVVLDPRRERALVAW
jgi:gamma-glutamyltranspeptidase